MKLFNTHHNSRFHSLVHSDLWNFEFSVWLHMIGWSIISIFIPILMLSAGYSLPTVLIYEGILYVIDTPLNFLAGKLTESLGAKAVIIIATFFAIAYFIVFRFLSYGGWTILLVLALLAALYDTFYWVAHIYLFIESSGRKKDVSRNNGILNGIRSFAGMLGPAIGAGILIFGSQLSLLVVTIVFLLLSIPPLLLIHHAHDKPVQSNSFKEFFQELPEKRNFLTWFLYSINSGVEGVIWPIFIFTLFGTLNSIALVAIVISISKILLSYVSGVITEARRERFIFLGILMTLVVWIARLIYPVTFFYYASILLTGLFAIMVEVPLDSMIFERARLKNRSLSAAVYRNAIIMFPQGVLFLILALLVGVFKVSFGAAIASLLTLLVVNRIILSFSKKLETA